MERCDPPQTKHLTALIISTTFHSTKNLSAPQFTNLENPLQTRKPHSGQMQRGQPPLSRYPAKHFISTSSSDITHPQISVCLSSEPQPRIEWKKVGGWGGGNKNGRSDSIKMYKNTYNTENPKHSTAPSEINPVLHDPYDLHVLKLLVQQCKYFVIWTVPRYNDGLWNRHWLFHHLRSFRLSWRSCWRSGRRLYILVKQKNLGWMPHLVQHHALRGGEGGGGRTGVGGFKGLEEEGWSGLCQAGRISKSYGPEKQWGGGSFRAPSPR